MVEPVVLASTGEPGESPADRAAAVARQRALLPQPPRRVPGWTSFRWPECHAAIPVLAPVDAEGTLEPFPKPHEVERASLVDGGFFLAPEIKYGIYRRVKDRLFRVWTTGVWDESVLREDGTYLMQSENQKVDAFIVGSGNDIGILAPAGFEGGLEQAEKRAAEVLNES